MRRSNDPKCLTYNFKGKYSKWGNIWDWANFWELFNANVHSQPLPDLYKFNYLLNALKGEAYGSVKKFQVTPDNYMKAIDFLRNKYENTEELVTRLIDRLENCQLRSPMLKDQRSLLEQIQVVIMQLIRQGEQVDGQWFIKQVLSKFPTTVQRKVLTKKHSLPAENSFKMETLLKFLEEIISGEEMISLYMKKTSTSCSTEHTNKQVKEQHKFQSTNCMYCGKSHKSFECDRYKTPQERSKYLREHKLCLICASPQHITSQCKKRLCFKCQGAHHTSCCFKYNSQVRPSSPPTEPSNQVHQAKRSGLKNNQIKDSRTIKSPRKVNQLSMERPSEGETAILELQSAHGAKQAQDTFLPTGEMTVLDPRSKTLRKIPVLLDTGAEVSFIDTTLADELNLPTIEKTKLRLHTFGSDQVQESNCRRVPLEVWDSEGKPFSLNLITHEILTKSFVTPPIRDEDIDFIKCKNLPIQLNRNMATVKPLVLLGCDQLWSLIRDDQPHIQLPSGLHLLPTRLGHLLTGQLNQLPQVKDEAQLDEKDTWNGYWTLEAQVHIVTTSPQTENSSHERELWEKFWASEAAGTEEFSNSEREEQALVDKQVWDNFKRTVEKREDGYYVRLPWKDITTKLPDNRAIAYRRLISVWNSLQKNDELLNKYQESVLVIQQVFIFSDSEIVLGWIRKKPLKDAGLMVSNRLVEIDKIIANLQDLGCQVQFGHVPSAENPADCGTRGLGKADFQNHFWWKGPEFLKKEPQTWTNEYKLFHLDSTSEGNEDEDTTCKEVLMSASTKTPEKPSCVEIFSSLQSYSLVIVKRIVAYVLRFIRILVTRLNKKRTHPVVLTPLLQEPLEPQKTSLSAAEVATASKVLAKQHQLATITQVILRSMPHLNVQKDEEGLLRCFGRLGKSTLEDETKNPMIILQNSWLAQAVIRDYHMKGHPSISHTMALVRQKFWIPKLRAQVTRIIRRCIACQRLNNLPYKYPMQSDLPKRRVQKSRPFEHVGLDYFGPLPMALTDGSQGKCYGAILTCMVTRMVHLDIASDLSTVAFLRLLRRFFGRRGVPRTITSDNAPTFTMGEAILKDCVQALRQNPGLSRELSNQEQVFLRTKTQAVQALQSSCQFTEKFWNIWQTQYLTSLREKHQIEIDKKRRSNRVPKQGDVVLISEPIQPRHCWKMGRVDEVIVDSNGEIREATVILPSKRKIRRPVNLLIPFEIEDEPTEDANLAEKQALEDQNKPNDAKMSTSTYDLRPRKKINYNEEIRTIQHVRWTPFFISTLLSMAFLCGFSQAYETSGSNTSSGRHSLRCIQGGVELITLDQVPFEICAEDSCQTYLTPQVREIVKFPPQVVLHEHSVHWKFTDNHSIGTLETICPPAPFCEYIDCTVCSALIFNPECWPVGAILAFAIVAYFVLTGCYVFPLVIGQPIRWTARFLCQVTRVLWNLYRNLRSRTRRRQNRRRSIDLVQLLAIIILTGVGNSPTSGCQLVNVFSHSSTICTEYKTGQVCKIQLSEILKINPFKREACFKLTRNQTTIHEIRASWKNLVLTCEKETHYFTRDTDHNVIDSKRCPHMGSCVSNKCAAVNSSSIIPELDIGNKFPGNTYCVESCGGPGCDCFYWGSGCLFYRIYLTPRTTQVFEVYHCNRWQETVAIEFTHFDAVKGKTKTFLAHMLPNVPIKWKSFTFTLTSITVPPMPLLHTSFISDGNNTALWKAELKPSLRCNNETAATKLRCEVIEDCTCYPAETQANCKCKDLSISNWFNDLRHRLPVVLPAASIQNMLTAEIILTLQENLSTNLVIDNDICTIDNAILVGCYNCARGAQARVKCASSEFTKAEVLCDTASFTIPCDHGGIESVLQFSFAKAQVQVKCSVSCGEVVSEFEIGGILKFTDTIHGSMIKWLEGRTNKLTELQLPDLWHIANVFLQWYKTLIATLVTLLFIVGLTYVFLSSCGIRILTVFLKLWYRLIHQGFRLIWRLFAWGTYKCVNTVIKQLGKQ
ncbi:Tas retrotransposon peptidase A16 [Ancylostoma ceylanicum]|uniref:Tas retrotransposon peptidase A16 n=1 Tax=Ancylostoma ceylanicum TaxID=53326 RepID=A0A0D6M318_9BILA|nr:Tas retrotransposon peptidase A16 [Ancylostoma ceylanicum]